MVSHLPEALGQDHSITMQELLSKTDYPKTPLRKRKFYELSLLDEAHDFGTRYCARQGPCGVERY